MAELTCDDDVAAEAVEAEAVADRATVAIRYGPLSSHSTSDISPLSSPPHLGIMHRKPLTIRAKDIDKYSLSYFTLLKLFQGGVMFCMLVSGGQFQFSSCC